MSPKNNHFINVGLTALGWFGFAATSAADPGPPGQPAAPAVTAAAPTPSAPTVLSLTDGRVLSGKIQVDDNGYSVVQNGGTLRFRKEQVEGAFGSLPDVYRFKAERVPARDPDERLKLAHWCLSHHLRAEAKAQLLAVLEFCPTDPRVKDMITNIDQALARESLRDEGLVRTRAERPMDGRPAEMDAALFQPGRGVPPVLGLPVIFDLPQPIAVKRADEFSRGVHSILQRQCARCHHENYPGDFQLIQVKNRHQWTPNVARANLEATLRMVDPDNPSRSELLARSLVPHGPLRRPIFRGANDPEYRRIAAWVNSLKARPATESTTSTRFGPLEPVPSNAIAENEGFATDRVPPPAAALPPDSPNDGRPQPPATPNPVTPLPPGQLLEGSGGGAQAYAPPDTDFPVPYMMGGPRPKAAAAPNTPAPNAPAPPSATQAPGAAIPPPAPVNVQANPDGTLPPLPNQAATPPAEEPPGANSKPAKKPFKLDPALLERALSNKYAPR